MAAVASPDVPPVVRASWRGGLPVLLECSPCDFATSSASPSSSSSSPNQQSLAPGSSEAAPLPSLVFCSRQSFLPFALAAPLAHLRGVSIVPEPMQSAWMEAKHVPLKWQYPIGAIFDTICGDQRPPLRVRLHLCGAGLDGLTMSSGSTSGSSSQNIGNSSNSRAMVTPIPGPGRARQEFFHLFKQGMFLRFGSRLPFTELGDDEDDALWRSVVHGHVDEFCAVIARFRDFKPKAAPVRILTVIQKGDAKTIACTQVSLPLNSELTVTRLLQENLPGMDSRAVARCQGIEVPMDAKVVELYEALAHGDMFLYICLHVDGEDSDAENRR